MALATGQGGRRHPAELEQDPAGHRGRGHPADGSVVRVLAVQLSAARLGGQRPEQERVAALNLPGRLR